MNTRDHNAITADAASDRLRDTAMLALCVFVCVFVLGFVHAGMGDRPLWRYQPLERALGDQWRYGTKDELQRWDEKRARGKRIEDALSSPPATKAPGARPDPTRPVSARRWDGSVALVRGNGDLLPVPHKLLSMDWYGRSLLALFWATCAALAVLAGGLAAVVVSPGMHRRSWTRAVGVFFIAAFVGSILWLALAAVLDAPDALKTLRLPVPSGGATDHVRGTTGIALWAAAAMVGAAYAALAPGTRRSRVLRGWVLAAVAAALLTSLLLYAVISVEILPGAIVEKG